MEDSCEGRMSSVVSYRLAREKPDRDEPPSSTVRNYFSLGVRNQEEDCKGKIVHGDMRSGK